MTIAIVGRTGSGKSYTAKGMIEPELAAGARVCVIDPTGAWWGVRVAASGEEPGYPVVIFGGDHADIPIGAEQGEQLADLIVLGTARQAVVDISDMSGNQQTAFLTAFLERLYAKNRLPLTLVMDEADVMAPQNPLPEQRRLQGAVNKIVRRGRIKGFRPIMITQRPAVLDKSVLSQIDTLIAMRLTSPQDRKAIEDWVKGNADADQARQVLDSLASLPRGEGWYWAPADGVLERRVFPAISTFDSSRTPEPGEVEREVKPLSAAGLDEIRAALVPPIAAAVPKSNAPRASADQIAEAERRGYERGVADGDRRGFIRGAEKARLAMAEALNHLDVAAEAEPARGAIDGRPTLASIPPAAPRQATERRSPRAEDPPHPGQAIQPAKKKLLDAIAWLSAFGNGSPARIQVAMVAGVSHVSSSFANNLGSLRASGLIDYPQPNALALTNEGWELAERPDAAPSNAHVMAKLGERLQPALMRLLEILVGVHPKALQRADLADAAGVSASSSSFANNLGRLSSLGLVTYPRKGEVRADDALFPEIR